MRHARGDFPDGFVFGTATSAYQIEGHAAGGAGLTHWDSFAATPGNVARAENGARACDHYHRWEEDLDLVRDAGFDAYRFSTSWARVMPDGRTVNPEGLDFYDRLVDGMLARGIRPAATLYHWELPADLAVLGGWQNREIPLRFAAFAETVMGRIGDRVWSAAPVNEPWCVAWLSHFIGAHAPGLRDIRAAARAVHHVLLAHGLATQAMRGLGMANLGCVFNMEWAEPWDGSPESRAAAARADAIYNRVFAEAVFLGRYPTEALEGIGPHLPDGWQDDFATIGAPLDWAGLNYYTRKVIAAGDGPWPATIAVDGPLPRTAMGWEIHPEGLGAFLRRLRDLVPHLPIHVTENGMAGHDSLVEGRVDDRARIDFIDAHLGEVRAALADGVNVAGYFVWSLLDNYEWALGYDKRFGLVHVDFDSLARTPKASYHALARSLARDGHDRKGPR